MELSRIKRAEHYVLTGRVRLKTCLKQILVGEKLTTITVWRLVIEMYYLLGT